MAILALPTLLLLLSTLLVGYPHIVASSTPLSPLPVNLLRSKYGFDGHPMEGVSCHSWRLAVETHNVRNWMTVPLECEDYVGNYMLGHLYRKDSKVVVDEALRHAKSVELRGDGKDIWIFDIDETTLSNIPYYAVHGFGAEPFNSTSFDAWVVKAKPPALSESLRLFDGLLELGIKLVFLTGPIEAYRAATTDNLRRAVYANWDKLLLKSPETKGSAIAFKSEERRKLVEEGGYKIVGNIGDQWSDILGYPEGDRTFKLPNPMYYIG